MDSGTRNTASNHLATLVLLFTLGSTVHASLSHAQPVFFDPAAARDALLELSRQRLDLMDDVAAWKWRNGVAIHAPQREQALLENVRTQAVLLGLAPETLTIWFEAQMAAARQHQQLLFELWTEQPTQAPSKTPTELGELRRVLDSLGQAIVMHFYQLAGSTELEVLLGQALDRSGPASNAQLAKAGTLRIGTTGDYPPFSVEADGRLQGFDIDMALDLARILALEPVFVRTSWSTLEQDLLTGRFDIAMGGITLTDRRRKVGAFSEPYRHGGKTAIGSCTKVARFDSLAAINRHGVRVIVNPGGNNERYVRKHLQNASIIVYPDNLTIFEQLATGAAELMITDAIEVELQILRDPRLCRSTPALFNSTQKAYLLPRGSELLPRVDAWLQTIDPVRLDKSLQNALVEASRTANTH